MFFVGIFGCQFTDTAIFNSNWNSMVSTINANKANFSVTQEILSIFKIERLHQETSKYRIIYMRTSDKQTNWFSSKGCYTFSSWKLSSTSWHFDIYQTFSCILSFTRKLPCNDSAFFPVKISWEVGEKEECEKASSLNKVIICKNAHVMTCAVCRRRDRERSKKAEKTRTYKTYGLSF